MSSAESHLSSLTRDALAMNLLSGDELARAHAHLATCERCRRDAEELQASRERFDQGVFLRTLPKLRERRRKFRWPVFVLAPALAAAMLALLLLPRLGPSGEFGIKGGPALQLFARREGRVFPVTDGARLSRGDEIRFAVTPSGLSYLLVVSVDGAGQANVYFPFGGAESGHIDAAARVELPGSIVLDNAPGPERIFALFSKAPLAAAEVTAALRQIAAHGPAAIRSERRLPVAAQAQLTLLFDK